MRAVPALLAVVGGAVAGCFSPPAPVGATDRPDSSAGTLGSTAQPDGGPRALDVDPPSYLGAMALSQDYVYFVAWRNGVYRIPKYGGDVVAIQEDPSAFFHYVAATASTVVWIRSPYNGLGQTLPPVLSKQTIGEDPVALLELASDTAPPPYPFFPELQVTGANVFFNNGEPATIHQVPLAGGTATAIDLPHLVSTPSWFADDRYVYYLPTLSSDGCALRRVALAGGAPEDLAPCPAGAAQPWLVAIDATDVYLASEAGFWKVPTGGGDPVALFMAPAGSPIQRGPATIDDQNIYFVTTSATGMILASIPKAGGPPTTIWDGYRGGLGSPRQLAQDRQNLFVLDEGIALFAKTPAGAGAPASP